MTSRFGCDIIMAKVETGNQNWDWKSKLDIGFNFENRIQIQKRKLKSCFYSEIENRNRKLDNPPAFDLINLITIGGGNYDEHQNSC